MEGPCRPYPQGEERFTRLPTRAAQAKRLRVDAVGHHPAKGVPVVDRQLRRWGEVLLASNCSPELLLWCYLRSLLVRLRLAPQS